MRSLLAFVGIRNSFFESLIHLTAIHAFVYKLPIMGFNHRFDPTFARVRQAVAADEIGTPPLLHIISRDPGPPPLAAQRAYVENRLVAFA